MPGSREISIVIEYDVAPELRRQFLDQLLANCADTLRDDGCLRMEVAEPADGDTRRFVLTERWRSDAHIQRHRMKPGHDAGHAAIDRLVAAKRVFKGYVIAG